MSARFQLVVDYKDPELLNRFWAAALGYVLKRLPAGFATWDDWRRDIGLPAVSREPARTASSIPAVRAPVSGFM
jgi:hypothetical protein